MPTAYLDHIETLSMTERNGIVRSLTRMARVVGLTNVDYGVLMSSLEAVGIPAKGSRLAGVGFSSLVLTERNPSLKNDDNGTVDVTLQYEHDLDADNQDIVNPFGGIIRGRISCSVQQVTTNFAPQYDLSGRFVIGRQPIILGHRFPASDPDFPGQYFEQGGEVSVFQPQRNFHFQGFIDTNTPWTISDTMIAAVNAAVWHGQGPREWMCTEVVWEQMGYITPTRSRYKFSFDFQHNPDTWDTTAVFIDERTGRPPPGLLSLAQARVQRQPAPGYGTVYFHHQVNFGQFLGAYFEGVQQA